MLVGLTDTTGGCAPVMATTWGLSTALSVIVSVALRGPDATGVKTISKTQVPLGATVAPFVQVVPVANVKSLFPASATVWISKVAFPVLCKVTVCGALGVPIG